MKHHTLLVNYDPQTKYFPKAELVDFTVEKIVLFTAYLFEEGKSPNTISTYLRKRESKSAKTYV
jgi:hypothetical protein